MKACSVIENKYVLNFGDSQCCNIRCYVRWHYNHCDQWSAPCHKSTHSNALHYNRSTGTFPHQRSSVQVRLNRLLWSVLKYFAWSMKFEVGNIQHSPQASSHVLLTDRSHVILTFWQKRAGRHELGLAHTWKTRPILSPEKITCLYRDHSYISKQSNRLKRNGLPEKNDWQTTSVFYRERNGNMFCQANS